MSSSDSCSEAESTSSSEYSGSRSESSSSDEDIEDVDLRSEGQVSKSIVSEMSSMGKSASSSEDGYHDFTVKRQFKALKRYFFMVVQVVGIHIPDLLQFLCIGVLSLIVAFAIYEGMEAKHDSMYQVVFSSFHHLLEAEDAYMHFADDVIEQNQLNQVDIWNSSSILEFEEKFGTSFWEYPWSFSITFVLSDRNSIALIHGSEYITKLVYYVNSSYGYNFERTRATNCSNFYEFEEEHFELGLIDHFNETWFQQVNATDKTIQIGPFIHETHFEDHEHDDHEGGDGDHVHIGIGKRIAWPTSGEFVVIKIEFDLSYFEGELHDVTPDIVKVALANDECDVVFYHSDQVEEEVHGHDSDNNSLITEIHSKPGFEDFDCSKLSTNYISWSIRTLSIFRIEPLGDTGFYMLTSIGIVDVISALHIYIALVAILVVVVVFVAALRIFLLLAIFLRFQIVSKKSTRLAVLGDILPPSMAKRIVNRRENEIIGDYYPSVTVIFIDVVNFSIRSQELSPLDLLKYLNRFFTLLDGICPAYGITKIKTIGDAYLAVSGCPDADANHAVAAIRFAKKFRKELTKFNEENPEFETKVRIGVNSGSVVAGVVGEVKMVFDIWGSTVNFAERVQKSCSTNEIRFTGSTYSLISEENLKTEYLGNFTFDFVEHDLYKLKKS